MIKLKRKDFSLEQICNSGQCFRINRIQDTGRFSVIAFDHYLEMFQEGREIYLDCSKQEMEEIWNGYFDLQTDYTAFWKLAEQDPYLSRAIRFGQGIRILRQDLWEMVVSFIISQQNNIKRIRGCIETLCRNFGEKKIRADGTPYMLFPQPEALAKAGEKAFRECGLGYRSRYIDGVAKAVAGGSFHLEELHGMEYREAKEKLKKLPGIGEKVADCICLFALHQLEAFPVDTHIRKVLKQQYPEGFLGEPYAGCQGVMQQYIFYYDLMSGK